MSMQALPGIFSFSSVCVCVDGAGVDPHAQGMVGKYSTSESEP